MLRVLVTAAVVATVSASAKFEYDLAAPTDEVYAQWLSFHGKVGQVPESSYEAFEANRKVVEEHNAKNLGWTLGLTQFAGMTHEKFAAEYLGTRPPTGNSSASGLHMMSGQAAPASVDWRTSNLVTPVKNQGSCGSCWAFSTIVSIEGQHAKKTGKLVSLSEQNLVDCVKNEKLPGDDQACCDGCQGGLMDDAFAYMVAKQKGGVDTETAYGYKGTNGKCDFESSSVGASITGYKDVASGDESALKDATATVGPISVGVDANMGWQLYHGGVMSPWPIIGCSSNKNKMDHGVAVVGYGTDGGKDYWIIKNSWGEIWGEKGYMRLIQGKNACGVANGASYPTV